MEVIPIDRVRDSGPETPTFKFLGSIEIEVSDGYDLRGYSATFWPKLQLISKKRFFAIKIAFSGRFGKILYQKKGIRTAHLMVKSDFRKAVWLLRYLQKTSFWVRLSFFSPVKKTSQKLPYTCFDAELKPESDATIGFRLFFCLNFISPKNGFRSNLMEPRLFGRW